MDDGIKIGERIVSQSVHAVVCDKCKSSLLGFCRHQFRKGMTVSQRPNKQLEKGRKKDEERVRFSTSIVVCHSGY
jgi:hypothetical protein